MLSQVLCLTLCDMLRVLSVAVGLCLEGARWDKEDGVLKESLPNQLHPALPVIQVYYI